MSGAKPRILFLVDEIKRPGLSPETHRLVERLRHDHEVILVAQCYLKSGHPTRRLPGDSELYGFPAEDFDAEVARFAEAVAGRRRPQWAVAYGWENPQLVAALDALDVPILLFLDHATRGPHAEVQIYKVYRHATEIVFGDVTVRDSLTTSRWALEARAYRVLDGLRREPRSGLRGWVSGVRRRFGGETTAVDPIGIARTAAAIAEAGARCAEGRRRTVEDWARDARQIEASGAFDLSLYLPPNTPTPNLAAIDDYLRASQLAAPRDRPFAGRLQRRPLAGFNPLIYASDNDQFDETTGEDPLAHFLRSGRPEGRWTHRVLQPGTTPYSAGLKAAIHGHFHYPDQLPDLLTCLAANSSGADLVLTTTSDEGRDEIARILADAGIEPARLAVYPNRGRDIWSFVDMLRQGAFQPYDAVGHVHAKRSPHYTHGAAWRDFLWNHLVGGRCTTMDAILAAFAADPRLGLVFAEDPHLTGWEENRAPAEALAARAGLHLPLPNHFDYPMGTMFWARPAALTCLSKLELGLDEIPAEPLPQDGTLLHALERLIPFLVEAAGYGYATTHVAGSRR